jgi:serine/threonine protein phosphatase PrpC
MEDAMVIKNDIVTDNLNAEVYAICDGHGGSISANYTAARLEPLLRIYLQSVKYISEESIIAVVQKSLSKIDKDLKQFADGTTIALVLIINGTICITANVGDSRCVLARRVSPNDDTSHEAIRLTTDHKPTLHEEEQRLRDLGAVIVQGRINGYAVSRSLGDHKNRPFISAEPYTHSFILDPTIDHFFIIGCDGIWDVISDAEAVEIVSDALLAEADVEERVRLFRAAHRLVDMAIASRSKDNISAIIVQLPSAPWVYMEN